MSARAALAPVVDDRKTDATVAAAGDRRARLAAFDRQATGARRA